MYVYNMNIGGLTKFYGDSLKIAEVAVMNDDVFVIRNGELYVVDPNSLLMDYGELESGLIPLDIKARTTDAVVDRIPREECFLSIENENGVKVDYNIDEHVFKINLAKGHKCRFLKYYLKFGYGAQLNKLQIILDEEVTL